MLFSLSQNALDRWIRPVTKSSADYRDLDLKVTSKKYLLLFIDRQHSCSTRHRVRTHDDEDKISEHKTHNPEGVRRTRIPQAFSDTFKYVPKSSVDIDFERERGKDQADSSFARLTQKMNRKKQ